MSYLRFNPSEYRMIAALCREQRLGSRHQPGFRRLLVESLRVENPELATRIARLGKVKLGVLYWHFRDRTPLVKTRPHFTDGEMRLVAEACITAPFPVRLVRPFKHVLIELFQEEWPRLAQKLLRLSGSQFEQVYEQAVCNQNRGHS